MPYGSKRRFGSKKRYSKRRTNYNSKSIKRLDRKIKKIDDMIELKYVDSFFENTVGNDGADILLMNGIPTGSGNTNRIGNEYVATSVQFRGSLTISSLEVQATRFRCIVFWDRQANNAVPATTTFTSTTRSLLTVPVGSTIPPVLMPFTYEMNERYRILYDKMFTINPLVVGNTTTGATDEVVPVTFSFKKKIKLGRKVKCDGGVGDITDISTNSLYAVFYSDLPANEPGLEFSARMYFKDA